jgi:hypothetical protein
MNETPINLGRMYQLSMDVAIWCCLSGAVTPSNGEVTYVKAHQAGTLPLPPRAKEVMPDVFLYKSPRELSY